MTPKTWQEVDLAYYDNIKGKSYPASIQLLRPITWLKHHGMHQVGKRVVLSISEFGINQIQANVTAIKPTTLDTSVIDWSKQVSRPVIGKFKRYASIVKTYTFKNLVTGKLSTINTTPNHQFYIENKKAFIPIDNVTATDKLVSEAGQPIRLLCFSGKQRHCGKSYNNKKPVPVYNLEIYQQHIYFVGHASILVHNNCRIEHLNNIDSALNDSIRN